MTAHGYLTQLLIAQSPTERDRRVLREIREQIEADLRRSLGPSPRFYYGGSYGKGTMLSASFDLDIVVYYPHTDRTNLDGIYGLTHYALTQARYIVEPKTVALRLPFDPPNPGQHFHVDVVPGRAHDATYRYATLYRNERPPSSLQTSLKVHIEAVKGPGLGPVVRLLKLWRLRHDVPLSTFMLEILAQRALAGQRRDDFARALSTVLDYIDRYMTQVRLEDPANTNNIIWVSADARARAARQAAASSRSYIENVVW